MTEFKYLASRQALEWAGERYAQTIEKSIDEHLAMGIDTTQQTLGERLEGNDGD
jgi:hypothetical protein